MTLLVLITILILETFATHLVVWRQHNLITRYARSWVDWLSDKIEMVEWAEIVAVLLPPVLLLGLFLTDQHGVLGFLVTSLIGLIVVFWCLGPQSLAQFFDQLSSTDEDGARQFISFAHQGYFAVIIWFVLAGPIMALVYRIVQHLASEAEENDIWHKCMHVIDWLPARVTALLYMMTGSFVGGLSAYRDLAPEWYANNQELVERVVFASLLDGKTTDETDATMARQASERTLILLIVIVALVTLFDI